MPPDMERQKYIVAVMLGAKISMPFTFYI